MKKLSSLLAAVMICVMASPLVTFAADAEEYVPKMYASIWSLVPPVVAIALALITKEVYSSLFVGILVGGIFYSGISFELIQFILKLRAEISAFQIVNGTGKLLRFCIVCSQPTTFCP